jgi:lipopolysaccharide-induced tumor necrosis factor-alpha factor
VARARRYDEDDDDYGGPVRRREDDYDDDPPPRRYDDEDDRPSRRYRDDDDDDEDEDRFSLRRGFRCPHCRSRERPNVSSQVSPAGWVVFVMMIMFCVPLCFIGLLMTEETRTCSDCGRQVS